MGSDEKTRVTEVVIEYLEKEGMGGGPAGPLGGQPMDWADVARAVGERVASGAADQGVLFCWTGTGTSIAANKVPGIRAALCNDAETARGARKWNDANVLVMSLRSTPEAVAREICDAWLEGKPDPAELPVIDKVRAMDEGARGGSVESGR